MGLLARSHVESWRNGRVDYVSPALSERKQQRLQEKLDQAPQMVVFEILRDSRCSEYGAELERGPSS